VADEREQAVHRVLVVAAHPDDVDFGSAGTIATWADDGLEVSYCIVTDVEFLGYPDGRLTVSLELRRDLTRVIRQRRPDRMMIPSPHRDLRNVYVSHPDHQAAGEAALCAVYPDARNPFAHPELLTEEGLEAHTVPEVWVVSSRDSADYRANCYVDITDTFDRKIAALRAHTSQTAHMTGLEERIRAWGSRQAQAAGLPAGRLAEGYLVLDTR
jgi:LmbE family N-acetylglucosaminyl deacetylase